MANDCYVGPLCAHLGRTVRYSTCCMQATSTASLSARLFALLRTMSRYWPAITSAHEQTSSSACEHSSNQASTWMLDTGHHMVRHCNSAQH